MLRYMLHSTEHIETMYVLGCPELCTLHTPYIETDWQIIRVVFFADDSGWAYTAYCKRGAFAKHGVSLQFIQQISYLWMATNCCCIRPRLLLCASMHTHNARSQPLRLLNGSQRVCINAYIYIYCVRESSEHAIMIVCIH